MRNNKYTFWRLLSEKRIVIPIIQRDYAQGRKGKEYVRKNFLEQLGKAMFENQTTELDFVYGTEVKDKGTDTIEMFPLDGQQRLTTLWLLHWYVAYKAKELPNVKHVLKNFSYETRTSSREFCEKLCELEYQETNDIVGLIKQQTWFFSAWQQDPTVKAMLVMLSGTDNSEINKRENFVDGIEELFDSKENVDFKNCWDRLTSDECPIHFNFLPLQSHELPVSDDLYIKMNARGKALTSFENFKAELVDWIYKDKHKEFWGANDDEQNINRAVLVSAIDNQWTDIFWSDSIHSHDMTNSKGLGRIDEIYFAFLNRFFYNLVITDQNNRINDKNASENKYYAYFNNIDKKMLFEDFGMYEHFLSQGEHVFKYLANVMKNYSESMALYSGEEEAFENILKSKWNDGFCFIPKYRLKDEKPVKTKDYAGNEIMDFTPINQMERVVFYAICKYFNEGAIDTDDAMSLKRWMRFVWNLVSEFDGEAQTIRNINAMQEAISYIDAISDSHNVYEELKKKHETSLPNGKIDDKTALGRRFQEEIVKARKILETLNGGSDDINEDIIINAEQYAFFCGAIRFLFTNQDGIIDWASFNVKWKNTQSLIPEKFEQRHCTRDMLPYLSDDSIKKIFSGCTLSNKDANLRKLLLTYSSNVHNWLIHVNKSQDEHSLLHSHLDSVVQKHHDFWLHLNWENNLDVLSNYVYRSGDYQNHSIVVGSDIFGKAIELLSKVEGVTFPKSTTMPVVGLYVKFIYNYEGHNYTFRWQTSNWIDMYEGEEKLYNRDGEYKLLHTHFGGTSECCFSDSYEFVKELNRCIIKYAELTEAQK